jgi:WD40 repeat protein/tetratricopeptide (TPR) repeat protein
MNNPRLEPNPKEHLETTASVQGGPGTILARASSPKEPSAHRGTAPLVPDHELLRLVGRGAYGEVWLARNIMGEYRALKLVYRSSFEHDRPYEREFEGIQKFEPISRTHESQVDILHVGQNEQAGYFYYVMELADDQLTGQKIAPETYRPLTLKSRLHQENRLSPAECVRLGLSLTTALSHLHENGLVHRDIKPSNIIFINGQPKLADIGLVSSFDATVSYVGTLGFSPPEGPGSITADIYSLGKVLYEAVTGRDRQDFPELPSHLGDSTKTRMELVELNEIIIKACDNDPQQRYQSAEAMHSDLALLESGKSVARLHAVQQTLTRIKRVAAGIGVVTLLVSAGLVYQSHENSIMKRLAQQNSILAGQNQKQLAHLQVANGIRRMEDGHLSSSLAWYAEALANMKDAPDQAAAHRVRIASALENIPRLVHVFQLDSAPTHCCFSPDGKKLACRTPSGVTVLEVASGRTLYTLDNTNAGPPVFSPDGERLIFGKYIWDRSPAWGIYNANTGQPINAKSPLSRSYGFLHSVDGTNVLVSDGERTAQVLDLDSGEPRSPRLVARDKIIRGRLSANQKFVELISCDEQPQFSNPMEGGKYPKLQYLEVWEVATGQIQGPGVSVAPYSPALLADDGRRVAIAAPEWTGIREGKPGLRIYNTTTGKEVASVPDLATQWVWVIGSHGQYVPDDHIISETRLLDFTSGQTLKLKCDPDITFVTFSPDHLLVATKSGNGVVRVWNTGNGELLLPRLAKASEGLAFSADGHLLAACGPERVIRIWDLASVHKPEFVIRERDKINEAIFSPDGQKIITLTDWSVEIWDALTGRLLGPCSRGSGPAIDLRFSRDGDRFVTFVGAGTPKRRGAGAQDGVFVVSTGPLTNTIDHLQTGDLVFDADLSPDDRHLVTATRTQAQVWDIRDKKHLLDLKSEALCLCARFGPDGRQIVTSGKAGAIDFWDATTGQRLRRLEKPNTRFETMTFSPDWRRMATGSAEQTVALWSADSFKELTPAMLLQGNPPFVVFRPDGQSLLAFSGYSSFIKVWSIPSGRLASAPLDYGQGAVVNAEFSPGPDGRYILSCSDYGTAQIWNSVTAEPLLVPNKSRLNEPRGIYTAHFSPRGDRMITGGEDREARVWELRPCNYSQAQIASLGELLSGEKLDPAGAFVPSSPEEIPKRFDDLRSTLPEAVRETTSHEQALWHEELSAKAVDARLWQSVIGQVNYALNLEPALMETPTFDEVFSRRAQAHAELGQWSEAVADFRQAVQLAPDKIYNRYDLMIALLAAGCLEAYQKEWGYAFDHVKQMKTQHNSVLQKGVAEFTLLIPCAVGTNTAINTSRALELCDGKADANGYFKSLVLYRAGRFEQALDFAEQTRANSPPGDDVYAWLALALVNARAGRAATAQKYLDEAERVWSDALANHPDDSPAWSYRAQYQLLHQETKTVLSAKSGIVASPKRETKSEEVGSHLNN